MTANSKAKVKAELDQLKGEVKELRALKEQLINNIDLDTNPSLCLDEYAVSKVIGRSIASLRRDRQLLIGIPFLKLGQGRSSMIRYWCRDVSSWLNAHSVSTTNEK